jgi:hypothetical protein
VVVLVEWGRGPGAIGRVLAGWGRLAAVPRSRCWRCWRALAPTAARALDGFTEDVLARALDFADFTKVRPVSEEAPGSSPWPSPASS